MDNKFGMEQQETEEDITKEKVFCWSLFVKAYVRLSSKIHWTAHLDSHSSPDLCRAMVGVGATSHASDAQVWSCMPSGSTLTRTRRRRKSC